MKNLFYFLIAFFMLSCGSGNKDVRLTTTDARPLGDDVPINLIEQAKPTLFVMPSDQLLRRFGMIKEEQAHGRTILVRDFGGYLLRDDDSRYIISAIQNQFINVGFPLNDLEQTIRSIQDQELLDALEDIQQDAKTMLLTSARPDIILELDYSMIADRTSRNLNRSLTLTLRAIDAFSNQVIATIQQTGFGKDSRGNNSAPGLAEAMIKEYISDFTQQINSYFADIIRNGRNATFRVTVDRGINLNMYDECLRGDSYSDWIIDYMKANTVRGAYRLDRNTNTEIFFTNVRIKTLNENGTQYSSFDFAREFSRAMNQACGIRTQNRTQGLGDANVVIMGM